MSNNLICFGDVVKLATKSSFVDGDAAAGDADTYLGFLEQKKELLLVVPPVKEDLKDKFLEGEFIIAPVRGDKPPQNGTPLNYKQPFVLKTSDGSGYSLNNKTPSMSEAVSLRECNVKGEMYLEVHKEGFSNDTHVHDGDMNVELNIADSNRIRKTYNNKPLTHVVKSKSDTPGGIVSCSSKGRVLSFKLVKVAEKTETRKYVKDPVFRRASQMLLDPVKADETSEASVLESPSRAGSIVTTGPLVPEDALASAPSSPKAATPETETPVVVATVDTPVAETVAAPVETATVPELVVEATTTATTTGVSPVELAAQLQTIVVAEVQEATVVAESEVPETAAPIMAEETFTGLATIELSGASVPDMDAMDGSAPVHDKLNLSSPRQISGGAVASSPSTLSVVPESGEGPVGLPTHEEPVDTSCVGGKCSIM